MVTRTLRREICLDFGISDFPHPLYITYCSFRNTNRAAVPEAAVDEDGEFFAGEGDVGANR